MDITDYKSILQSDIYAYKGVKVELEKYDSGKEHKLPAEHSDTPVDSEIIKMIEENKMSTDPESLRNNFNSLLDKMSRIIGAIKQFMVIMGQNLNKRDEIYANFERVHPTKLVLFNKDPLWYQFLVDIASHNGTIQTSLLIAMYPERFNHLMNLTLEHGFVTYMKGGDMVMMKPDIVKEILFREHSVAVTPQEVVNKNYYDKTFMDFLEILSITDRTEQLRRIKIAQESLLSIDVKDHVELGWIPALIKADINDVFKFINTSNRDLAKILNVTVNTLNISKLSLVSFFKPDIRDLSIEVFDHNIFMNLNKEVSTWVTKILYDNKIATWGQFFDCDIEKVEVFTGGNRINVYRLMSFCRYFKKLLRENDRFYYKPIYGAFDYHNYLTVKMIDSIKNVYKQEPEVCLAVKEKESIPVIKQHDLAHAMEKEAVEKIIAKEEKKEQKKEEQQEDPDKVEMQKRMTLARSKRKS